MLPIEERDHVDYPKKIMKITELMDIGFPKVYLMNAYQDRNQKFAWKMDVTKKNSHILFDTDGLEEYRLKQIATEKQANRRLRLVM